MKKTSYIYKIVHLPTGKIYIGCTTRNPFSRLLEHKFSKTSFGKFLFTKPLEEFYLQILEICAYGNKLEREKFFISSLSPEERKNCFNRTHTGTRKMPLNISKLWLGASASLSREIRHTQMINIIRAQCTLIGSHKLAAEKFGISAGYLSQVLNGSRGIGEQLSSGAGYKINQHYEEI